MKTLLLFRNNNNNNNVFLFFFLFVVAIQPAAVSSQSSSPLSCSVDYNKEHESPDPNLHEMAFDVGNGKETMMAYIEPDISSFYNGNPPSSTKVVPKNKGLAGKFINLSKETIRMYWESHVGTPDPLLMNYMGPFEVAGTATFTGHNFMLAKEDGEPVGDNVVHRVTIGEYPENIVCYDPYFVPGDPVATEENLRDAGMTPSERERYDGWRQTLDFNEQYRNFTGRTYLASYLRKPPTHFMWRGDYFGQEHWVTTRETHFETVPPPEKLGKITAKNEQRILKPEDPRLLQEYRTPDQTLLNMTLRVISVAPRVLEIPNFLSQAEIDHILNVAAGVELSRSTVGNVGSKMIRDNRGTSSTRTSKNSWIERERTPITDAVYRRAADLLRIDEALFRQRGLSEDHNRTFRNSMAEHLQLVHYDPGQEYAAHHDFGFSIPNSEQGARFSTLLLYLNSECTGGDTSFPRWVNGESFDDLRASPEAGKAILFYSQLPDGNLDDFSHHAALPVREGEKWLINLWVWDPVYK